MATAPISKNTQAINNSKLSFTGKISLLSKATNVTGKEVINNLKEFAPNCINEQNEITSKPAKLFAVLLEVASSENLLNNDEEKDLLRDVIAEMPSIIEKLSEKAKQETKDLVDLVNQIAINENLLIKEPETNIISEVEIKQEPISLEQQQENLKLYKEAEKYLSKLPAKALEDLAHCGNKIFAAGGSVTSHKVDEFMSNPAIAEQTKSAEIAI